jgi:recombination protein RecR
MNSENNNEIDKLIYYFSKLPGLGQRSARRIVLHLINQKETLMLPLSEALENTANTIKECNICGNIDISDICNICQNSSRNRSIICVVETIADLWALERGNIYKGLYHVLGGTLSMHSKRGPNELKIEQLVRRTTEMNIEEIIIATNSNLEGQTTAFYITEKLENTKVKISKLAHGLPIGGELDYLDEGTISAALLLRQPF